jgi:hypothetical protein
MKVNEFYVIIPLTQHMCELNCIQTQFTQYSDLSTDWMTRELGFSFGQKKIFFFSDQIWGQPISI